MRLLLAILIAAALAPAQRRMPPQHFDCPRDQLTAYTGKVTAYTRTDALLKLTLATDWNTTEKFALKQPAKMLLRGEPFRDQDWSQVEERKGKLKPDVRATVWECRNGARLLDWQPPRE